jgi:hypothetical protein
MLRLDLSRRTGATHRVALPTSRSRRLSRLLAPTLLVLLSLGMLGTSTAGAVSYQLNAGAATAGHVASTAADTPMVLQNVTLADLVANKRGICNGGFTHVIKNAAGPNNARNYLNAAQACGLKVIFLFPTTVNHSLGKVYPSRVASWVKIVKNHPALFGYLTVKEPSWNRISASEIRSLYAAFKKADPNHPVLAIFGDIPHFNLKGNSWGTGMADILIVDWYPVETARNGCSRTGTKVVTTGPRHLKNVRAVVDLKTPGTPVWVMVQTHKNLAPACHKKQRPTEAQLRKQVRDAINYAKAVGIAFHTFDNSSYAVDERRDPTMVGWMRKIANEVHAGTFQ